MSTDKRLESTGVCPPKASCGRARVRPEYKVRVRIGVRVRCRLDGISPEAYHRPTVNLRYTTVGVVKGV